MTIQLDVNSDALRSFNIPKDGRLTMNQWAEQYDKIEQSIIQATKELSNLTNETARGVKTANIGRWKSA